MNPDQDFVMRTIESRDVHFVRFWFTDVLGNMKSFAVSPSEMLAAFEDGMGFDGSCIAGFSPTEESDVLAFPDPATFQVLPWRPAQDAVARMFCDIRTPDGASFEGDPRHVLRRVVASAAALGYEFNVGPELEYYYFKDSTGTQVLDTGGYFSLTGLDSASDLRRDTVLTLEKLGIPVEYSHHETGPSQHEIDLRYADALSMADAVMTYKLVVKEIASQHGVYASFMPKPATELPGNGMHVHQSLMDQDGRNLFHDVSDPLKYNLSDLAKNYIAGILKFAPEFCLITNQFANSYRRLSVSDGAPTSLTWGRTDRSALVRVPGYRPHREEASRIELRSPDPGANPYLAFAVMLASGLEGIKLGLTPPPPVSDAAALQDSGVGDTDTSHTLPADLGEAIERFEGSTLMRETLGDHIHSYLVQAKKDEWAECRRTVTDWERARYLAVL